MMSSWLLEGVGAGWNTEAAVTERGDSETSDTEATDLVGVLGPGGGSAKYRDTFYILEWVNLIGKVRRQVTTVFRTEWILYFKASRSLVHSKFTTLVSAVSWIEISCSGPHSNPGVTLRSPFNGAESASDAM